MEDKDIWLDDDWGNLGGPDIDNFNNKKWSEERKQKHKNKIDQLYADPEYKKKWNKKNLEKYNDPVYVEKITSALVKMNKERFTDFTYIVRTPGNDLLDFYDQHWKAGLLGKCFIPPSVIFQLRFREQYEPRGKAKRIREVVSEYVNLDEMGDSFLKDTLKFNYKWLVDEPHKSFEFESQQEIIDHIASTYNRKSPNVHITPYADQPVMEYVYTIGNLAGVSMVAIKR